MKIIVYDVTGRHMQINVNYTKLSMHAFGTKRTYVCISGIILTFLNSFQTLINNTIFKSKSYFYKSKIKNLITT